MIIAEKKYDALTTSVFGGIGIVRVPFREIHGANACKDIKRKDDGKEGCPLEPGTTYTYSNTFPILKAYPAVSPAFPFFKNPKVLTFFFSFFLLTCRLTFKFNMVSTLARTQSFASLFPPRFPINFSQKCS